MCTRMDPHTNPSHYRYLEMARRRHYAGGQGGRRGRGRGGHHGGGGGGGNGVGILKAVLGLGIVYVFGRMTRGAVCAER